MTVCVAALCSVGASGQVIVGASDRMVTAGNTESEPNMMKVWWISNSIVVMVAGDLDLQTSLLTRVMERVNSEIEKAPETWVRVRDVARFYEEEHTRLLQRAIERTFLVPLGLDFHSFAARQKELDPVLVNETAKRMREFRMSRSVEAIFAGIDQSGAGLFMWANDELVDRSTAGYACIGIGWSHAESEFISAGHVSQNGTTETVVLVHSAKKRAESAPGVGAATDLFTIGPGLGSLFNLNEWEEGKALRELDKQYKKRIAREKAAAAEAAKNFNAYAKAIVVRESQPQRANPAPPAPPDKTPDESPATS